MKRTSDPMAENQDAQKHLRNAQKCRGERLASFGCIEIDKVVKVGTQPANSDQLDETQTAIQVALLASNVGDEGCRHGRDYISTKSTFL